MHDSHLFSFKRQVIHIVCQRLYKRKRHLKKIIKKKALPIFLCLLTKYKYDFYICTCSALHSVKRHTLLLVM